MYSGDIDMRYIADRDCRDQTVVQAILGLIT
jgi:hypothetical protein